MKEIEYNIADLINSFDCDYKALHNAIAPSYLFDYILRARSLGYMEGKKDAEIGNSKPKAKTNDPIEQIL